MPTPHELLKTHFGFSEFRSGQQKVVDALLAGRSALAVFPTGGGKSLCYQLPALALDGLTVVVSPLIALMKDQIDFLTGRGIPAARLDSTLTPDEALAVLNRLNAGTLKLLYVAPERFNNERFHAQLSRLKISLFAIDEAHCISEWGHNFRPDYLKLAESARELKTERVLALTATATPSVVQDIRRTFRIAEADAVVTGFYRANLRLATTPVSADKRDALLLSRLTSRAPGPTIVYVTLQKTAERIAAYLAENGLSAEPYHAGMESDERSAVQDRWMASDSGIVVATIAFGMGIDKANVRYVYHYNLPKSLESYSQEIGRAGRDNVASTVELFACEDDVPVLENFAYGDTPTEASLRGLLTELLSLGSRFDVALYDLSGRHDLRPLVLRTVLTYLELTGVLHQGTPFYAGYEFRPTPGNSVESCAEAFPGPHGEFIEDLFRVARKGRLWYALNPDNAAETLGVERKRIVRALEVLNERGLVELKVADSRMLFTRLRPDEDIDALTADLVSRFTAREDAEMRRLRQVLDLVTADSCQTNRLVGYFGEEREAPCGHCTFCLTGKRRALPVRQTLPPIASSVAGGIAELRETYPEALYESRQVARFLCGLSTPALTRAKLHKNPLFGSEALRPFAEVLAWATNLLAGRT